MNDIKKFAVIVRDRQDEALRVACGLMLAGDMVDIYILDRVLEKDNPAVASPLEMIAELELKMYSNNPVNNYITVTLEQMAKDLLQYDMVVPY